MNKEQILSLLKKIESKEISPEKALTKLQTAPFEDLGYATLDLHRGFRQASNEVIFGQNKTPEQIFGIVSSMLKNNLNNILITRISAEAAEFLSSQNIPFTHYKTPKLAIVKEDSSIKKSGSIVIVSGGTSDLPVCEEAAITAETLGNNVERLYDVGVSGLHRILSKYETLIKARVIIVVAGMEGALASVVGGLVSCPVIAVPTSVGYGASFNGLSALLSMLNSCSSGVSVVNIDNGFGAGYIAGSINKMESIK
ncbi:MAG: nickel pincer cofactor biosynthesis protein LarB [Elusimicrobiota bacterium]|jgi:NCAIR mutase (PurE)-related protein|nr:nickel pincer cofactor biosynthesis protein LarB [Elusimicrobiota bacterium]